MISGSAKESPGGFGHPRCFFCSQGRRVADLGASTCWQGSLVWKRGSPLNDGSPYPAGGERGAARQARGSEAGPKINWICKRPSGAFSMRLHQNC